VRHQAATANAIVSETRFHSCQRRRITTYDSSAPRAHGDILMLRDDPLGVDLVFIGIGLQIIGVLIIRRIIDVEY
jgi:hypothetical protein